MTLISAAELAGLQEVAELGMQTEVSILRYMKVERTDWDEQEVWVETAQTTAMIWSMTAVPTPGVEGGIVGDVETYRALIRVEIEVEPGDHIGVAGQIFVVVGDNEYDTYQPAQILALRRFE